MIGPVWKPKWGAALIRTMTSNEVRKNWGTLMKSVEAGDEVIVKSRGVPKVVVISYSRFLELLEFRRQHRRRSLIEQLMTGVQELTSSSADREKENFEDRVRAFSEAFVAGLSDDDLMADE